MPFGSLQRIDDEDDDDDDEDDDDDDQGFGRTYLTLL